MKCFVVLSVFFVFVSHATGQGYGRQRTRPNPVIHQTGAIHDQPNHQHVIHNPIHSPRRGDMPAEVLAVIGSTITGEPIGFEHVDFPVHGGTRDPTGRTPQGWGQDPAEPLTSDVTSWNDPMRGAQFPEDFQGEPLIFNEDRNRWEREHQRAKATNYVQINSNHLMPGHGHRRHVESKIVEQQVHNSAKQNHNAIKSSVIQAGRPSYIGSGHGISTHHAPDVQHNIVKSSIGGVDHISGTANVFQENPVHRVHKVSKSGVAAIGHDRLAANLGTAIAKEVISQSSSIVDFGSNGGVSSGNQIATAAALGLAKEASHIVGDIINTASQSNIGHGQNTVGSIQPIPTHPKPVHPKPVHPKPTHTNLVHHTSVHHSSIHPKPVHPKPFYPKSLHPKPSHPKPVHPRPVHHKPTHTNLAHHTSVHHSSVHPKPVHSKPAHPKPFYPKSFHPKPSHPKPVHPKPVHPKPTHTNLVHHTSVHHSSVHPKPVHPKPFYPKSLHSKPVHPKPTHPKPTHTNLVHHTSVHHSSVHPKPIHPKPVHPKPSYPKSRHPKPSHPKPGYPKPTHPKPTHTNSVHHSSVHHSSVHPKPVHPKPFYPKSLHSKQNHHTSVHHTSVHHTAIQHKPVHPKPAYPKEVVKKPKLNTGYGRRH